MRIIEIAPLDNGAHRNQSYPGFVPDSWAVVPDSLLVENFPFGTPTVEEVNGVPTVTAWMPGVMPEQETTESTPTAQDDTDAMLVDHEYRLTLLELGLTE